MKTEELPEYRIEVNLHDANSLFQYVQYMKFLLEEEWGVKPDAMSCGPEEILKISAIVGEHRERFPYLYDRDPSEPTPIHFDYPKQIMGLRVYLKQSKGIDFLFEDTKEATRFYPRKI